MHNLLTDSHENKRYGAAQLIMVFNGKNSQ